jgi:hypothetical protein
MRLAGPRCKCTGTVTLILKEIGCELDLTGLRYGAATGFCEHGNESSCTMQLLN